MLPTPARQLPFFVCQPCGRQVEPAGGRLTDDSLAYGSDAHPPFRTRMS